MESFPHETSLIINSGCEIGLHGYSHEGAYQMTPTQERDVLLKCIGLVTALHRKPVGYRAPLYQIRETTVALLREHNFLYDSSMNAHDSLPYFLPEPLDLPPNHIPDFSKPAESWMHPLPPPEQKTSPTDTDSSLIEIPTSWYTEDMTPLGFYPYMPNSQGYVSTDVIEKMWWDRFIWLWDNECDVGTEMADENQISGAEQSFGSIFTLIIHPESAGRSHVIGMIDRFLGRMISFARENASEGEITFETMERVALDWREFCHRQHHTSHESKS